MVNYHFDYYPFGMTLSEGIDNSDNRHEYNGKELDCMHGLDYLKLTIIFAFWLVEKTHL